MLRSAYAGAATYITDMERVFSAVAPTGTIHIGNYLGAVKNWVDLQYKYECFFCVADLHAITAPWEPTTLAGKSLEVARVFLAAGLDPGRCALFVQSHVPFHSELCWVLSALAKVPNLERMTQYKEKGRAHKEKQSLALLSYPVLMAADILLYKAGFVPVGEDQTQHLELVRLLSTRFNDTFGEFFPVPEALVVPEGARIMGLDDPGKKMSKTAPNSHNYIALTDTADIIREKIRKAVTDPGREIRRDPDKPAISNLLNIYVLFAGKTVLEVEDDYRGKGYLEFKNDLADLIIQTLAPFQQAYASLTDEHVREVLLDGKRKAEDIAAKTMAEVREKIGFLRSGQIVPQEETGSRRFPG
jgi:tryptophanyl-tRNA synthetase